MSFLVNRHQKTLEFFIFTPCLLLAFLLASNVITVVAEQVLKVEELAFTLLLFLFRLLISLVRVLSNHLYMQLLSHSCSLPHTVSHLNPTLFHLLDVCVVELVIVCLDCSLQLVLGLLVLFQFFLYIFLFLFLSLLEVTQTALVIDVSESSP